MFSKKCILSAVVVFSLFVVSSASAQNVGRCGWGSKLFDGQKGIAPQVLAVTTNGTSGNQTFAITTGTSGCTQNGLVRSNWQTAMFVDQNMTKIAKDMSQGRGESLDTLAALLGMNNSEKEVFAKVTKENYSNIFANADSSSDDVLNALKNVLASNSELAKFSTQI